jgi:flagellar biosynthetic protein FliP
MTRATSEPFWKNIFMSRYWLIVPLVPLVLMALSGPAMAQDVSISLGEGGALSARTIQLILLVTVLSLAPGIAIMITCFPFMVTVLSILRQGIGLQQSPPNMLIISLALFLTYFVMEPVFTQAWQQGVDPMLNGTIEIETAIKQGLLPFREFMAGRVDPDTFSTMASLRPDAAGIAAGPDAPLSVLVPSFLLSEIARAFQIGFLIFLPFLIIDLVVAAILMSMGMMMVPPAIVSLPFKLAFFVIADGWALIAGSLVKGYF